MLWIIGEVRRIATLGAFAVVHERSATESGVGDGQDPSLGNDLQRDGAVPTAVDF
jgi:hypothetical protein